MEKVYKTMGITGAASIVIGIVLIVVGVAAGVLSIIYGNEQTKKPIFAPLCHKYFS